VDRRAFLRLGGGLAAGSALLLSACQSTAAPRPTAPAAVPAGPTAPAAPTTALAGGAPAPTAAAASAARGGLLPAYIPLTNRPVPDLPSPNPAQFVEDGFVNYPANPQKALPAQPPGAGGPLELFVTSFFPVPTPYDQNPAWQEMNRQLNATVRFNIVPSADYNLKLATLMAGGDLPDVINLFPGLSAAPSIPQFLDARCADLTPYLSGDAIKDYPNLANIPTAVWKNANTVVNGRLRLIPIPRPMFATGSVLFYNKGVWDGELGPDYTPTSADDFKRVLTQLNRPAENRYAIAVTSSGVGIAGFSQIFNAPNNWRLDNGRLIKDRETEEYKAAVAFERDLFVAGLFHPNTIGSYQNQIQAARTDFVAGRFIVHMDGVGNAWADFWQRGLRANPPVDSRPITPFPAVSGSQAAHYLTNGATAVNALKQASPERIQEILRIMNWLSAPFGSQEDLLIYYGLPTTDYTLDGQGNPVPTAQGTANASNAPWRFIARSVQVLYNAGIPDYAKIQQAAEMKWAPVGVMDATFGYYSATAFSKTRTLDLAFTDGITDIVAGRRPLGDYDQLVAEWQRNGGDQMRAEFLESMAAS
jgi:putative aldouronate transport system substrate-binding protein